MWSWHTNKINVVTGTLLRYNGQQDRYVIGKQYCGHRHVDTKAKCLILKTKKVRNNEKYKKKNKSTRFVGLYI